MTETTTTAPEKMSLTTKIMIAMLAGAVVGVIINLAFKDVAFIENVFTGGIFLVVGTIFVNALKMMVVPLVFVSLVCGVTALADVRALGRIGGKALVLYLITTALAISIALSIAVTIAPGAGFDAGETTAQYEAKPAPPITQVIIDMVAKNPVEALADGRMLQIIVFALLLGIAITLTGERGKHVYNFFSDLNEVIMQMVFLIMKLAPYGVFCLIAKTFAEQGIDIILPLITYFLVMVTALLLHGLGTFSLVLTFLVRINPLTFFKKIRPMLAFAFSTASSAATLPITFKIVQERLGVNSSVSSFTLPLGATLNMDGTAIMQGVATVFIANVYGVDLGLTDYLLVILTATLASVGTAAVPGVGLITLAMVLDQVGLPVEGIALIIGVDRLLDMIRTSVNVTGDATVSCLVAKTENALDMKTFNDPKAGLQNEIDAKKI